MKFEVTAQKMVIVGGSIVTIKAGELESTDEALCKALQGAKGVNVIEQKVKVKK